MREVVFSKKAQNNLTELKKYLENRFSTKFKDEFVDKLENYFLLIQNNPELFPKSNYKNYYKCVVSKQNTIFYSFNSIRINIVSVFDTRQNPNTLNKL